MINFMALESRVGSGVVRIDPLCFLARCCTKATIPGYFCFIS